MNWQETIALSIVAVTAGIMLWSRLRPRPWHAHGPAACGSCSAKNQTPVSIRVGGRKGERARITVSSP